MFKVFDTSAFLNRFFFNDIEAVITTNSVLGEIKNREQKQQIDNLIQRGKIHIKEPSERVLKEIQKKALKGLSKTDIEIVALAEELKLELYTDDFMIRKYASDLGIKVKGIAYEMKEKNILDEVYEKIKPTKEELQETKRISKEIIIKLRVASKKLKMPIKKIILAGSSARGTFITNKKDLDFFLLFDLKCSVEDIKIYNEKILKTAFPKVEFWEEYGEHPYLKCRMFNNNIDFVPGFYITKIEQKKSAVDRTPLHLRFLQKYQNEEIKKQVILLKQFLKNNLLYGADQKNNGFSGYLTELFILKFQSFEKVLKAVSNLEKNKYLYIKKPKVMKKFDDYFIFVDPTDENRNVASAVSKKNWQIFNILAKEYLKTPKEIFFFGNNYNQELPKNLLALEIEIEGKTPDVKWGIIKGIAKRLANELNTKHYNIDDYSGIIHKDEGLIVFESKLKDILRGPELKDTKNSKAFRKKHKNTYVKDNRLYCDIKFTRKKLVSETKRTIRYLIEKPKIEIVDYNKLKLTEEELKRIKKDFLKL